MGKILSLLSSDTTVQGRTNGFINYLSFRLNERNSFAPLTQPSSWNQEKQPHDATANMQVHDQKLDRFTDSKRRELSVQLWEKEMHWSRRKAVLKKPKCWKEATFLTGNLTVGFSSQSKRKQTLYNLCMSREERQETHLAQSVYLPKVTNVQSLNYC